MRLVEEQFDGSTSYKRKGTAGSAGGRAGGSAGHHHDATTNNNNWSSTGSGMHRDWDHDYETSGELRNLRE
eukprot:CAMPEP_0183740504 /NCGR_PEP_ID=MMETSP0737-20130205/59798_1 /TAXON_ID=385413 /ORGANISM="Thalassiosira miniscula, Strain CCMP1093" /LENGTH=70 /DNA_ID=CAMNT_0025975583 /DNA_START=26 /DNA_END=235 /DNA_ORIENTATION=+